MENNETELLLYDEFESPVLVEDECAELKPIVNDFITYYAQNKDNRVEEWLPVKLKEHLPEKSSEEINSISEEIITTLQTNEENQKDLAKAIENGRSKESWFASAVKKSTSAMGAQQAAGYLTELEAAMSSANDALYKTITTQAGAVNNNPSLDGFIAEQYHAQTFNLNAQAKGSEYRAKVLEPTKGTYTKNSVDIVIVDGNGKVVKRYQSKYCKDANATSKAFEHGDYRGQQKLVPEEQQIDISKKSSTVIEAPDGTTSNPLTKTKAEQMRDEAQSGKWNELNWNEYAAKDLAVGIGKQAGYAALQGAAIGVGVDVAVKLCKGEKIDGEEIVNTAIQSGADMGVKAAAAGALKVGVEKGIIKAIPKGTPAGTVANIAYVAIENVKVLHKVAKGELTLREGYKKLEQTTVATTAGLITMGKGAAIGAAVGGVFGPVGAAVGGFVGGAVGYAAGSKVGETVVKVAQKVRHEVVEKVKSVAHKIGDGVRKIGSGVKNLLSGIFA